MCKMYASGIRFAIHVSYIELCYKEKENSSLQSVCTLTMHIGIDFYSVSPIALRTVLNAIGLRN